MTKLSPPGRSAVVARLFRLDDQVTKHTNVRLLLANNAIPTRITRSRDDPYAAHFSFTGGKAWGMSLSLLAGGLTELVGDGDVRAGPFDDNWVMMNLRNASEDTYLMVPRKAIQRFVAAVREQVPPDIDDLIDAELRAILTSH
jgi:hypothetical protein